MLQWVGDNCFLSHWLLSTSLSPPALGITLSNGWVKKEEFLLYRSLYYQEYYFLEAFQVVSFLSSLKAERPTGNGMRFWNIKARPPVTHLLLILSKQFHYLGIESSNIGAKGTILIQSITHNAYRWLNQSDWILWNKESQSDGKEDLFHDNRDCHSFCPCFSLRYALHPLPETGVLCVALDVLDLYDPFKDVCIIIYLSSWIHRGWFRSLPCCYDLNSKHLPQTVLIASFPGDGTISGVHGTVGSWVLFDQS